MLGPGSSEAIEHSGFGHLYLWQDQVAFVQDLSGQDLEYWLERLLCDEPYPVMIRDEDPTVFLVYLYSSAGMRLQQRLRQAIESLLYAYHIDFMPLSYFGALAYLAGRLRLTRTNELIVNLLRSQRFKGLYESPESATRGKDLHLTLLQVASVVCRPDDTHVRDICEHIADTEDNPCYFLIAYRILWEMDGSYARKYFSRFSEVAASFAGAEAGLILRRYFRAINERYGDILDDLIMAHPLDAQASAGGRGLVDNVERSPENYEEYDVTLSCAPGKRPHGVGIAPSLGERGIRRFDVFISHAWSDTEIAELLAEEFAGMGLKVWYYKYLFPPRNWGQQISQAIENSHICVVLLSKASASEMSWVSVEWPAIQESVWRYKDLGIFTVELGNVDAPPFLRRWPSLRLDVEHPELEAVSGRILEIFKRRALGEQLVSQQSEQDATVMRFSQIWQALSEQVEGAEPDEDLTSHE